jgi:hypothetical protein
VVALLPPNRQRVVNVVAHNAGRTRPPVDVDGATTDVPEEPGVIARLQAASTQGDERAFIRVCQTIDWQARSANDHIAAIQLALAAGAHLAARHLALEAAQRFPDHVEIQKYAHVLSPPSVTKSTLPADPSVKANRDWLSTHGDLYRGQWVVLQNGQLLVAASSPDALNVEVGNTRGALLLIARNKANLDIFWLRDDSLEGSATLPDPDVLAAEIIEELQAALMQFSLIVGESET